MYTCANKGRVVTKSTSWLFASIPYIRYLLVKSNKISTSFYNSLYFFILYIHILLYFPYISKKKNKKFKNIKANSTWCSQAVTHPSTNQAQRCLTSLIGREAVHSTWYGRWQWDRFLNPIYMLHLGLLSNFQICIGKSC